MKFSVALFLPQEVLPLVLCTIRPDFFSLAMQLLVEPLARKDRTSTLPIGPLSINFSLFKLAFVEVTIVV